jgi:hypothetical protein
MRAKGKRTHWNGQKGYGFITPSAGAKQVFAHRESQWCGSASSASVSDPRFATALAQLTFVNLYCWLQTFY